MQGQKMKRTHYAGELREKQIGEQVVIMGWVQNRRDLGGVIFLDIRDTSGICQVVVDAENISKEAFDKAQRIRLEYVVGILGDLEKRTEDRVNEAIPTGTIDVKAKKIVIFSESKRLPFEIESSGSVKESLRLKHRYLELRKPSLQDKLRLRQEVTRFIRNHLYDLRFTEIETPILTKSTPEGARDYLVPSRIKKGGFYALPQSPQVYKQLLMVGGMDRYFQIAKCFRDEDLRADRQPEFTQVDLEMSFVDENDVIELLERMFASMMQTLLGISVHLPFRKMTYEEAMEKYGSDKPDLRFEMPMCDVTALVGKTQFEVFTKVISNAGVVKAITVKGGALLTRNQIDTLTEKALSYGGSGLAWLAIDADESIRSVLTKYFSEMQIKELFDLVDAKAGDLIFFCAEPREKAREILGKIRLDIGDLLGLRSKDKYAFVVVTEFPLLEYDSVEKRYIAMHHPFTMALDEDLKKFDSTPSEIRAKAYDVVLNGVELGSGSIRIHDSILQKKMFDLLGFEDEEAHERFGFLLEAFNFGVPPHGGFAFGLDRFLMLITGSSSIREVIAFPKMKDASCPMIQSPSFVDASQLDLLGIHHGEKTSQVVTGDPVAHETIDHMAKLAMLRLTDLERQTFSKDLSEIIAFADQLSELDLEHVSPMYHLFDEVNVLRKDQVVPFRLEKKILVTVPKTVE